MRISKATLQHWRELAKEEQFQAGDEANLGPILLRLLDAYENTLEAHEFAMEGLRKFADRAHWDEDEVKFFDPNWTRNGPMLADQAIEDATLDDEKPTR